MVGVIRRIALAAMRLALSLLAMVRGANAAGLRGLLAGLLAPFVLWPGLVAVAGF